VPTDANTVAQISEKKGAGGGKKGVASGRRHVFQHRSGCRIVALPPQQPSFGKYNARVCGAEFFGVVDCLT